HFLGGGADRRFGAVILDEVAEVAVFALADRAVEADRMPADLENAAGFFNADAGRLGGLLNRRLPAHLLKQLFGDVAELAHRLNHVHWDTDGASLVGDGPGDGLANPPGGIGAELVAAAIFIFVNRTHQPGVAFLNQVEEAQTAVAVFLGDAYHQAQIAARQIAFGLLIFREAILHYFDALAEGEGLFEGDEIQVAQLFFQIGAIFFGAAQALEIFDLPFQLVHAQGDLLHLSHERLDALRANAELFD